MRHIRLILLLSALPCLASPSFATSTSIELSDIANLRRVGVESFHYGTDALVLGFDVRPDGTPIPAGSVVDTTYLGLGVRLAARLTNGPSAGMSTDAQALNFSVAPNY